MNLTIEKFFTILAVIFVILFINHISAGSVRSYIWEGTNRRFANRLENCARYTTPVSYYAPWNIPQRKYKTQIVGKRDGACVIREYYANPLAPFKHYNEYRLSLEVTKELSDILKTAFKESRGKEEKAAELALQFQKKYEVFCGYEERNFDSRQRCIKESLNRAIFNPKNKQDLDNIKSQLKNDYDICQKMQQKVEFIVSNATDFVDLSKREQEEILCKSFIPKSTDMSYGDHAFYNDGKIFLRCYCNPNSMCYLTRKVIEPITRSECHIDITPNGVEKPYYWQSTPEKILMKNPYY